MAKPIYQIGRTPAGQVGGRAAVDWAGCGGFEPGGNSSSVIWLFLLGALAPQRTVVQNFRSAHHVDDDEVVPKPPNEPPLFGGKAVILFGGIDKEAMRRWQERVRAAKNNSDQNSNYGGKADAAGDHEDDRASSTSPNDLSAPDNAAD